MQKYGDKYISVLKYYLLGVEMGSKRELEKGTVIVFLKSFSICFN